MMLEILVFCFVVLKYDWHLFSWNKNELVEDKAKTLTSLSNSNFFERFNVNVAFIRIARSYGQNAEWCAFFEVINALV